MKSKEKLKLQTNFADKIFFEKLNFEAKVTKAKSIRQELLRIEGCLRVNIDSSRVYYWKLIADKLAIDYYGLDNNCINLAFYEYRAKNCLFK